MQINMNGNENDTSYRYKMPAFNVQVAGKGNGIYTIFNNINDISKVINHPVEVILKYIAAVTGSNYIQAKNTITGTHTSDELKQLILLYIKYLVMCPVCNIPETVPEVEGSKKNVKLKLCCSACKNVSIVKSPNKHIDKGNDIIIKYLNAGGAWKTTKGTMVQTSESKDLEKDLESKEPVNEDPFSPFGSQEHECEDFNPFS